MRLRAGSVDEGVKISALFNERTRQAHTRVIARMQV